MRVAIFAGHVGKDSGAISPVDPAYGDTLHSVEVSITSGIASKLYRILNECGCDARVAIGSFDARVRNTKDCTVGVDIHCDVAKDRKTHGYHCMYYSGSKSGMRLADRISDSLAVCFDRHRPVWHRSDLAIMKLTSFPVAVVECGFLTCPTDEAALSQEPYQHRVAFAIADGLRRWEALKV